MDNYDQNLHYIQLNFLRIDLSASNYEILVSRMIDFNFLQIT